MKKLGIAILGLVAVLAVAVGPAVAGSHPKIPTRITLKHTSNGVSDTFKGKVKSPKKKCKRGRQVSIRKVTPGKDATIGRTKTNKKGRYKFKTVDLVDPGKYYSKALKKRLESGPHPRPVCKAAKSHTVKITYPR